MNYFSNCKSIEDIKKTYRKLSFENHPDLGGCEETMKVINDQYHKALKGFDGTSFTFKKEDGSTGTATYTYNPEHEQEVLEKLQAIQAIIGNYDGAIVWLAGSWIWLEGIKREHDRTDIKAMGFRYDAKKNMWYWRSTKFAKRYFKRKNSKNFQQIRDIYGAENRTKNHQKMIAA